MHVILSYLQSEKQSLYIQLKERLLRIAFDKTDFKNSFNLFHCY